MQARDVFLLVAMKLQDLGPQDGRRWPWSVDPSGLRASLVDFLNAAVRQVSLVRPDATAVTEPVRLELGMLQRIPDPVRHGCTSKAALLLDLTRNMGADGRTPGTPIVLTSDAALAGLDWSLTGVAVDNYCYDARENPGVFRVYPGVSARRQVWVEASFSAQPTVVQHPEDTFPLPVSFAGPVEHWMLFQAFSGDNSVSNLAKAQMHMRAFYDSLGVKMQSDRAFSPRVGTEVTA